MPIQGKRYTFSNENLNIVPDQAGVYALYDGDALIYYGRALGGSTTLRTRLKSHKAGYDGRCTQNATAYMREPTANAADREVELLREYKSKYGVLPRCNDVMP